MRGDVACAQALAAQAAQRAAQGSPEEVASGNLFQARVAATEAGRGAAASSGAPGR